MVRSVHKIARCTKTSIWHEVHIPRKLYIQQPFHPKCCGYHNFYCVCVCVCVYIYIIIIIIIIIIIGIQPLGELSQATGITLVRCILGKFLGVDCHYFPPPFLDVPTFATRCLHVRHDVKDSSGGRWNCGRECCPVIFLKWWLPRHLGIFYIPQIHDMGPTALLPLRRKTCWGFFRP